ncbi:MAG: sugar transferase, partial [Mycobacterium sp.]
MTGTRIDTAPAKRSPLATIGRTRHLSTILTVLVDIVTASMAVFLGSWIAHMADERTTDTLYIALFVPVVIALLALRKSYQHRLNRRILDVIGPVETSIAVASIVVLTVMVSQDITGVPGFLMTRIWICAAILMPLGRLVLALIQRQLRRKHPVAGATLIVGNGRV